MTNSPNKPIYTLFLSWVLMKVLISLFPIRVFFIAGDRDTVRPGTLNPITLTLDLARKPGEFCHIVING